MESLCRAAIAIALLFAACYVGSKGELSLAFCFAFFALIIGDKIGEKA